MWWWILGVLGGGLVLLVAYLFLATRRNNRRWAEFEELMEREGQRVQGWIVFANDALYKPSKSDEWYFAQIVFSLEEDFPKETLAEWAKAARNYKAPAIPAENERILGSVVKTHMPYTEILPLPHKITDGDMGYTVSVKVFREKLTDRVLSRPYLYCKVLPGAIGEALMIPYPNKKSKKQISVDE